MATDLRPTPATDEPRPSVEQVPALEHRVLWLATSIVHHATRSARTPRASRWGVTRHRAHRWSRS